ncbi:CapA family protein [Nonomuraea sp. NN258]|uniref:CapA family protein n=1 Tax=Nonomuraea antri TaxID=2730852 RepID=UPI001569B1CF|nr:CapA family protein [Nonomuraea antri]NRQ36736.1 CapA family protein [Nonomuraea antri]
MTVTLALAGDTMLGRGVADLLVRTADPAAYISPEVRKYLHEADLVLLNLECCLSDRGEPWAAPGKPFHFRGPPRAAELLAGLGVDCVTLANNHALDFGRDALLDTRTYLEEADIRVVGAGADEAQARAPAVLSANGLRIGVIGLTDHPPDYAAAPGHPGVAYADLAGGVPGWVIDAVAALDTDLVLVTPHWGPNMTAGPLPYVRAAASALVGAGASLVAGHSAHVFHGVEPPVLYDLGDFIDDYAVDAELRNDLSLLFLVILDERGPRRLRAVPLKLDHGRTGLAQGWEREWIGARFIAACAALGTSAGWEDGHLVVDLRTNAGAAGG